MNKVQRSYLLLHLSVIFWSFTAILGDLISLSAPVLVWWRVGLTAAILFFWPNLFHMIKEIDRTVLKKFFLIGILIGIHWVCFYASVKMANASIALITMSTTAFFTALIEPAVLRTKLNKVDVIMSLLIIPAMILTTTGFQSNMMIGFWLGILSSIILAYFTVLNRVVIDEAPPISVTFIEMTSAWVFLSICSPIAFIFLEEFAIAPTAIDWVYLMILAALCTVLPFVLHLIAMKHVSAFTTNLVINLEPIYGIILAIVILKEHKELSVQFYLGVVFLVCIVMTYPLLKSHLTVKTPKT